MTRNVLIVDDSTTIRDQLRRALVVAGFGVLEARDGLEGLETVRDHADLAMMICDVNMPRMGGIEMIDLLKESGCTIPILMLTTEGEPKLILKAKAAGARGWIVKPIDASLLVKAVQSLAR